MDKKKIGFMMEGSNYYYQVMPFSLKNAGAMYHRLMDKKYNMRLNPNKCVFKVQGWKFLSSMLTHRRIEVNPNKSEAIINMKSPYNYEPKGAIKSQALANFIVEMVSVLEEQPPMDIVRGQFDLKTSNNQAEYEALLAGLDLALEVGACKILYHRNSQLVVEHIKGTYQVKDPLLLRYYHKVINMLQKFDMFETMMSPVIDESKVLSMGNVNREWMTPIWNYLKNGNILEDKVEATKVRKRSSRYLVNTEKFYRRGFPTPLLKCLTKS
ncbi:hypothetical protein CR513_54036, partial [Mucuna pruriens]